MTLTSYFYAVSCFIIKPISSTSEEIFYQRSFLPDTAVLEGLAISHSLSEFSFSKDVFALEDVTFQDDMRFVDDDESNADDNGGFELNLDAGGEAPEDFFVGVDAVGDDYESGMGGGNYGGDNNSNGSTGPVDDGGGGHLGPYVAFYPRRAPNGRDLILALAETDGNSLEYFDQTFLKNWASPEHWKLMKKVIRRSKPSILSKPYF
jgi:condensin complex subunit 2